MNLKEIQKSLEELKDDYSVTGLLKRVELQHKEYVLIRDKIELTRCVMILANNTIKLDIPDEEKLNKCNQYAKNNGFEDIKEVLSFRSDYQHLL